MMETSEWLGGLKAGDSVAVLSGHGRDVSIGTVERATATQIVIGGRRYRRSTGWQVGHSDWGGEFIAEATEELVHRARVQQAIRTLSGMRWSEVPADKLIAVYGCLTSR